MPSSSPTPPLLSQLCLVSLLLFLVLFSSSPISATGSNIDTSNITHKAPSSIHPHQKCIHQHLSALLQLKSGFNPSLSDTNLPSWNANHSDCCSWEGITCDSFTGHVIGLNLSWLFITGVLDFDSLFHLRSLQRLDLSGNRFDTSPIPSGFGQLSSLTHLHLSGCFFYGQIPPDMFRLTRLVSLDLSGNRYYNGSDFAYLELESSGMGEIFRNLSNLRELDLDWVDMSAVGSHWSRIFPYALPNLRILSMGWCGLSGSIHPSLSRLHFLTDLDLSGNNFSLPVPQFIANFTSLTSLTLTDCGMRGEFPMRIFSLPKLQTVDISRNEFLTIYLPKFWTNSTIQQLIMRGTEFHGNLADFLGNFKSLTDLDLSGCNILGPMPRSHLNLTKLDSLDLSNNSIQDPIPTFIFDQTRLRLLELSSNNFSGVVDLSSFQILNNLELLDLSHNSFSSIINARNRSQSSVNISQPVRLYLDLSSNNFSGVVDLSLFQNLNNLEELDLSHNSLSSIINARNRSQSSVNISQPVLSYLDLSSNNFSGVVDLSLFQNLNNLKVLDLSHDSLSSIINARNRSQSSVNISQPVLSYLDLSSNNFSGVMDLGLFQNFRNLHFLDLSHNSFSSIINARNRSQSSVNISQPVLSHLDLSSNNFSGFVDLSLFQNLNNLEKLDLSHNSLSSIINARNRSQSSVNISQPVLSHLDLSSNNFRGVMDLGLFQNFRNLGFLDLSYNSFTAVNDAESNSTSTFFPQLSSLYLTYCNISKFPYMLRNQEKMRHLDLSCNRISGKIPQWIWAVGNGRLNYLNLSNNALEGLEGPFPHLSLSSVQFLDLSANVLKGSALIPPPSSWFFSLANNTLDGEVPALFCNATELQVLDLSSNNFTGPIPQCLGEMNDALVVLNLRKNDFHGPLLQTFKAGCKLETLDLSDNQLEGQMPKSLANCQMLTVLNLGKNRIKDAFPSQLGNLSELRVLVLRSNKFYGSIGRPSTSQAFFPQLQIIDVSFNSLSGSLPSSLFSAWKMMKDAGSASESVAAGYSNSSAAAFCGGRCISEYYHDRVILFSKGRELEFMKILFALTAVDFSHNQFHGDIPSSIGELKSLHLLNMSHNHFRGIIPASLGNIRELESLDLSQNSLCGEIPWQLKNLSFLEVLNLSQNQLTGSIPQDGQLSTFNNDSSLGNPGLCGRPLSRKCEEDAASTPAKQSGKKSELDLMWIGFGVGHAVGFGIFFWSLVLWRKARHAFFAFVDSVFLSFLSFAKRCGV